MATMTGAEALVESLVREKVEVIFGIPGVQVMELVDTICRVNKIQWISTRHEQTTAYMAMGYSRTTGKTGVAMVVPGPGALNASAAVGTAYAASTPLLLLAGQIDRGSLGKSKGVLHEMVEQMDVFRSITKWSHRVMTTEELPSIIEKAMHDTASGRPRPVEVEIPFDLWKETSDIKFSNGKKDAGKTIDGVQIRQAAELLAGASYPVIWTGGGSITSDASTEITALAEKLNAAVVTTPEGKGAFSAANPLFAGTANFASNPLVREADVLLILGSRFFFPPQMLTRMPEGLKVIQVDIDSDELGRNYPPEIGIIGDVREAVSGILGELPGTKSSKWDSSKIKENALKMRAKQTEVVPILTEIIDDIRDVLPEDGILIPGVTNLGYWLHSYFPVYKPRTYLTTSYFGTLGYAFPTALGAKIGNPDKPVVTICGDGGFLYGVGELATAVQYGINVITIVFVDNAYGACLSFQKKDYDNRAFGTLLNNPNFAELADSFGAKGVKLTHHKELKKALGEALKATGPVVIEVPQPDTPFPWQVSMVL